MKILAVRDEFRCTVLEPGKVEDLARCYEAKYASYSDDNSDIPQEYRNEVLSVIEKVGIDYFTDMFNDQNSRVFILLNGQNKILGSADLIHVEAKDLAYLCSAHILSDHRGMGMVDMLYKAREQYVRTQTPYKKMHLEIEPGNKSSQKAAIRNGFHEIEARENTVMRLFEKIL